MRPILYATLILLLVGQAPAAGAASAPAIDLTTAVTETFVRPTEDPTCGPYGCDAEVIRLMCGYRVLMGSVTLPITWYGGSEPPATFATVTLLRAEPNRLWPPAEQRVPIEWMLVDHFCCCPTEWYGEFAELLQFEVEAGDRLLIEIGDVCATTVVVPRPLVPQLSPMPADSVVTPFGPAIER